MVTFTDKSLMPFGKHKNKMLIDVPADYLLWLYDSYGFRTKSPIGRYIQDNMQALKQQAVIQSQLSR